jgi:hypothetical protein
MATTKKTPSKKAPETKPATKKAPAKKAPAKKAPAKKATRKVASVSPLRGMSIDDWIAKYTKGWQTDVVRRVVAVVGKAAPGSVANIKWRMPVFEANGPFAFVRMAKAHVTVGFWRGNEVEAPIGTFERSERMGHFKLLGAGELDEKALAVMVKSAVRLNREKGSPAMGRGA